jgi:hypothetical protein
LLVAIIVGWTVCFHGVSFAINGEVTEIELNNNKQQHREITNIMEKLPLEIACSVLKHLNFNELINICTAERKLPTNFKSAIREQGVWNRKVLHIKSTIDVKRCLRNISSVRNCTRISFSSGSVSSREMLSLLSKIDAVERLSLENFIDLEDDNVRVILETHGKSLRHFSVKGCQSLTNFTLSQISRYCDRIASLDVSECSFSAGGLEILAENDNIVNNLMYLDVSKCYLLDQGAIQPLSKLTRLNFLGLRNLEWVNSNNLPYIIGNNLNIKKVDVRNCDDFTKQSVDQVKEDLGRPVEILENTKLVDESAASIRGYLMALINAEIE